MRVLEMGRVGSVDEVAAGPLLGADPGRHEGGLERAGPDAEERMRADHLGGRKEPDIALGRRLRELAPRELADLRDGAPAGSRRSERGRDEDENGGERLPPAAEVEERVERPAREEREERRDGLGRAEPEQDGGEAGGGEESAPERARRGHPHPEDERRKDERRGDVPRVSDQGRGVKPRLDGGDLEDPEEPREALKPREKARQGAGDREEPERARRARLARFRGAGDGEGERRQDGRRRHRIDAVGVREAGEDGQPEHRAENQDGGPRDGAVVRARRRRRPPWSEAASSPARASAPPAAVATSFESRRSSGENDE